MKPHPYSAVVTGAFSYTGRYIARRLLDQGVVVKTLTNRPASHDPFGGLVEAAPLDFSDRDGLCGSMRGADVLFNTYWVRQDSPRLHNERLGGVESALLQREGASGGGSEGSRGPLRHRQAHAGLQPRRRAAQ